MNRFEMIQQQKSRVTQPRVLFVLYNSMGSITNRIRGLIFAEPFRAMDWTAEFVDVEDVTEDQLVQKAADFDLVYLLKIPFLGLIHKLRHHTGAKLVFDLTDALWMPHHRWNQWHALEAILSSVDAIFSDNEFVAAYGKKFNDNIHVIPACTQVERFEEVRKVLPARDDDKIVIGWVGTVSTINALHVIREPLERLFSRHPNLVLRLLILGLSDMKALPAFEHVRFSILPKYDEEDMIREVLQMDIGLFPPPCGLEDYAIRGPLKALIYMTGGVPPVCENGGVCAAIIQDGVNGMLASSPEEWEQKLEFLIASWDVRKRIGQNALATVIQNNSLKAISEKLASAILAVLYEPSHKDAVPLTGTRVLTPPPSRRVALPTGKVPKRIMIACSHFWPSIGGVENRIEQFSAALVTAGYEVTVLTPDFPGRTSNVRNGVRIDSTDPSQIIDGFPAWPYKVRRSLLSGYYDTCILIQDPLGNIIWSVEGASPPPSTRLIIQPIINADGYSKWKDHESFGPRLASILKGADAVVAMTKSGPENLFTRQVGINPVYIPNASSVPEPAGDFRASYHIPADRFVILHVANLYWVKNHIGLLETLRSMPESWLLVMVGNPSGEPECAQMVQEALAGRPDVLYIPGLSREWVAAAMKASDVIVLSSFGEGSPNTILEAMAQGKPWLATPQCGAANDHAGGFICKVAEFPRHLRVMQQHPLLGQVLGELGKQHWQHCLSWSKVVAGWIELIETGGLQATFEMPADIREKMDWVRALVATAIQQPGTMILPESRHAHRWLDGLRGLEIGPAAQNPFGLNTRFVGIRDDIYEEEQVRLTGSFVHLDIEARADNIPLPDQSEDFILSSHVIEHCPDAIGTLLEWFRIVKPGGLIYMIVPHRDAAKLDVGKPITTWDHFLADFNGRATEHTEKNQGRFGHCHYHVFDSASMRHLVGQVFAERLQLVDALECDDKIGNGFTLVYRKTVDHHTTTSWDFWQSFTARRLETLRTNPFVTIGMITYNRLDFTRQAIDALLIHTDYPYILTVVDNNSQDGTQEYLREMHRRGIIKNLVLLEENVGVAKASNLAWSLEPEALYYMKLDNDIVIQKSGWLSRLVACCDAIPQAGAVGYNFEPVSYPVKEINGWRVRVKDKGNLGGACILIPRRTHDKLGFWCEDYGLYGEEDADYGLRITLSRLLNIYMEDEEIGLHLPAGRAAIIDPVTFIAQDGKEELDYTEYRNWKDQQRRQNVLEGAFWKNVELYFSGTKPLYCYSDYLSSPSGPKMLEAARTSPLRVAVYSLDNPLSACAQIRIIQPAKELGDNISITWRSANDGVNCSIDLDTVQAADLILIQRFYPRQDTLPFIEHMLASGKPIIYEVDDLLTDIPDTSHLKQGAEETFMLLGKLLPRFTALTVSTSLLKEAFASFNPNIYVIPSLIDETLFNPFPRKAAGPLIIGFCGTVSHTRDLQGIEDALCRIAEKYGERVGFFFMGQTTNRLAALPGGTFKEFEPGYENYAKVLSESQIDIAIVPLEDKAFNRCKSNIKWLEYSACGIAGIYADLPPYNTCITQGETGILVGNTPQQWFSAIDLLIGNPELRLSIARNARQKVMTDCTLKSRARHWLDVYRDVAAKHGEKRDTDPVSKCSAKVSIIVPVFNQLPFTKQCLNGLFATLPVTTPYEIIVVNNGSTDETPDYLRSLADRIIILSNRGNLGFAKACNQGGQAACGEILLFLNNDTIPKSGWIESLIAVIDNDEADICGARLLYPDGRCQHAGIAFDERGLGYHIFGGFPGDAAPVMERRRMQAITGACLTVRKRLFHELGGFDEGFRNGFEDVDLCLRAGEKGKRILYVPESVLVHYAEQTVGRKDNDINNMQRYFSRWQGKVQHDDASLYKRFGLAIRKETDEHITVTPAVKSPVEVSIIIPLFNKAELTRACLQALECVTARDSYELVLVDNCSSDNTVNLLQEWEPKATIIRNSENRGFAVACNQGALAAKGKYLLFLNNDTEVTAGWLQPLITTLANDPSVAAVGSKLLFPDGTIQHAGVMVVDDQASKDPLVGRHYYVRLAGNYPPANRMMRMQAVTAACILIRRTAFEAVGGFDEGYWNGYEDLDLCFKLGEQNWKIIYQPASVILHHESQSGPERYRQAKNNISRLHARWLGKIKPDVIIMPDKRVLKGDGMLEGLVGEYECPVSVGNGRSRRLI